MELQNAVTPAEPAAPVVDLVSRPLPRIPPGTVIGKVAPEGWSHLVMIVIPTLSKEDLRDPPRIAAHYARMFKFTLLTRTRKTPQGVHLETLARGFAMTIRGKEIIVDPKNTYGGDLGTFGARILAENEKHIDADVRQVARTPTMALLDIQAIMRQGPGPHVRMILRHATLVDPNSGKEHSFNWLLSKTGADYAIAEKDLQYLPEGLREARYLSVKRDKFILGMPTPEAFGLMRTPHVDRPIAWTDELRKLAAPKALSSKQVLDLEAALLVLGRNSERK